MNKNLMIRTFVVSALVLSQPSLGETSDSSGNCYSRRIDAMQRMVNGASEVFDDTIKSPDLDFVDKCLGAIKQPRFDFGLSFPSIEDILSKVCSMIKSQIDQTVSGLDYSFDMDGFGNGYGSGSNTYEFPISDFNGASGGDPLYTETTPDPDFGGHAPAPENPTYVDQAVNNAMKFLTGGGG